MNTPVQQIKSPCHSLCLSPLLLVLSLTTCWPHKAAAELQSLVVEARDVITNASVPNVTIQLSLPRGAKSEATTNAEGIARFEYSLPEETGGRFFSVTTRGEGLVPLFTRWFYGSSSPMPPERLVFRMEKGTTIRGRVLDDSDQPVAGATVVVSVRKKYPQSKQVVAISYQSTKTDADGRWSFGNVPEQPDSVELATYHQLHLTDRATFSLQPFQPIPVLRGGSAVLRLARGTRVEGVVLAPNGQPLAGAEVLYGDSRGYSQAIPPLKANAQGKFTLGIKPGTIATLIARAPGFGPVLQRLKIGKEALRVDLALPPAHSLRGRVVDSEGKPISRANVSLYWSGLDRFADSVFSSAIQQKLITDDDGRFDWNEAPSSGVFADISGAGYAHEDNVALASDVDHEIVLIRPTVVKGIVVDAQTGEPLPEYSLTLAAAWKTGSPFIWQRGWDLDEDAKKSPGSFEYTISSPAEKYLLRAQADGYLPADVEPFSPDGDLHELIFRLTRAEPIRGTVESPDGSPAQGFVYLVPPHRDGWIDYLSLFNDDVSKDERDDAVHAKLDGDGRFSLPAQKENYALLVLADAGFALVPRSDLRGNDVLRLQPWARVAGTVTLDGKPAANLELRSYDAEGSSNPIDGQPRLVRQHYVKTDANGRFELPRVMPGRIALAQWVTNGVDRRSWPVVRGTVDVQSGQTYELRIGASGRLVSGRLQLPSVEVWMIRKAEIVSKDANTQRPIALGVEILEGGRFRALDLQPGAYMLRIALHEPPPAESCGWGRLLSEFAHEFTVPEGSTSNDIPLELGELHPVAVGSRPLQVGDVAPDFAIETLEGEDLKLAGFRGRYVLLDFWASWCAPCLAEMPNLRAINEEFAKDPRFVLIGVSLDEQPRDAAYPVKALKLSWLQGFAGPDAPVVSAYGATAIPATFLIGPDGKILARDLRGEQTKAAVAEALKP